MHVPDGTAVELIAATDAFIERIRTMTDTAWGLPPASGKWSPAQVAEHLFLALTAFSNELEQGPPVTPATFAPARPEYRDRILPRILRGGWFPAGAESPPSAVPTGRFPDMASSIRELRTALDSFVAAVAQATSTDASRHVRHPYFGALSVPELVTVLAEHTNHHAAALPEVAPMDTNREQPPPI